MSPTGRMSVYSDNSEGNYISTIEVTGPVRIPEWETLHHSGTGHTLGDAHHWLCQRLYGTRLEHSIGVCETAWHLAHLVGLGEEEQQSCALAGLLHDCAKLMSPDAMAEYIKAHGIGVEPADWESPQVLHQYVGAHQVAHQFGWNHPAGCEAIAAHTTGSVEMSPVALVVYVADKIEPRTRQFSFIPRAWQLLSPGDDDNYSSSKDGAEPRPWPTPEAGLCALRQTALCLIEETLEFLGQKHQVIHPRTVAARDDLVYKLRQDHNQSAQSIMRLQPPNSRRTSIDLTIHPERF